MLLIWATGTYLADVDTFHPVIVDVFTYPVPVNRATAKRLGDGRRDGRIAFFAPLRTSVARAATSRLCISTDVAAASDKPTSTEGHAVGPTHHVATGRQQNPCALPADAGSLRAQSRPSNSRPQY
jgi:hypothetical protein